jgi:methyl-accepting chemotaxis protein
VARFKYFAPWDWVVAASVPEAEYLSAADEVARLNARSNALIAGITLLGLVIAMVVWRIVSRRLSEQVRTLVVDLVAGAEQVASASGQLSASSQTLSQGASGQAASLEETSASMEEMASMTRRNADNSATAAQLMREVDGRVQSSNGALTAMVASMGAIEQSSAKVGRIIKTIDEIAFQTNILALNAAVEAARAGEAGMGFAVVADEVRNLAQRSAHAAKDTSALIAESIASAKAGHAEVVRVSEAIGAITSSVADVKHLVDQVSEASRQQAQGIAQVSEAVGRMEKVTQSTAATAEETAAASEQLNAHAAAAIAVVHRLGALVGGASGAEATPLP